MVQTLSIEETVGARIRELRKSQRYTLERLAEQAGISKSVLSKIENGKVSSPISTYSRICTALNISLSEIVRNNERTLLSLTDNQVGYTYYSLASPKKGRRMSPFLLVYPHDLLEIPTSHHAGEEFLFVLRGELEFIYGDKRLTLQEGDSLYIDAVRMHGARALGGKDCEALVIGTSNP